MTSKAPQETNHSRPGGAGCWVLGARLERTKFGISAQPRLAHVFAGESRVCILHACLCEQPLPFLVSLLVDMTVLLQC